MQDVLGQAIYDMYFKQKPARLWINNKYGPKEEMPVKVYFREAKQMPDLELIALQNCVGSRVLDIGAGAGSHALALQEKGIDVTALEISPKAVEVMKHRGVKQVLQHDIFELEVGQWDTLLLLMNGIGLAATVPGLRKFLQHAKRLIAPNGQLLFDSSDVAYLYNNNLPQMDHYYGEIMYQYEYKKQTTDWFTWLYVDQDTLQRVASEEGWRTEILTEDEFDQYLAKLTLE